MNYKFFREPVHKFIARGECDAAEFDRLLAPGRLIYQEEGVRAQMNLLDSHDTERFLTTVRGDLRRLRLATLFAMTYVGAPSIYYGDEIAMEGAHDPDCRRPFLWNWEEDADRVATHDYFRELAHLRTSRDCLTLGDFETLLADGNVYAFRRGLGDDHVLVVLNAGTEEATVTIQTGGGFPDTAALRQLLAGDLIVQVDSADGAAVTLTLPPVSGGIYEPSPPPGDSTD